MTDDELTTETPAMHHLSAQFSSFLLTAKLPEPASLTASLIVVSQAKTGFIACPSTALCTSFLGHTNKLTVDGAGKRV